MDYESAPPLQSTSIGDKPIIEGSVRSSTSMNETDLSSLGSSEPIDLHKVATNTALSSYFVSDFTTEDLFGSICQPEEQTDHVTETISTTATVSVDCPVDSSTLNRLRQRDSWLPSAATLRVLSSTVNGGTYTASPQITDLNEIRPFLSKPDVELASQSGTMLADPYQAVLNRYVKDESTSNNLRRIPPNPGEQSRQTVEGLKELVANGWYRAALEVTRRLLTNWGYTQEQECSVLTPLTSQVWLIRLALLVRIRNYELAETEIATFHNLDAPNVYFEHSPKTYPGRFGSIIPFSLRLLHAELPFYLGRTEEALDRLYYLLAVIGRMQSNLRKGYTEDGCSAEPEEGYIRSSLTLWTCREVRVLSTCLSIYLSEMDYQAAIETVHRLAHTCSHDPPVLRGLASVLGRIYIQLGDLETAKIYFARAISTPDPKKQPQLAIQQLFQRALLSIGKGEFEEGKKLFQQVLSLDSTNVAAANNMVVCSLYLGQLSGAIGVLETLTTTGLSGQSLDTAKLPMDVALPPLPPEKITQTAQPRRFCLHDALVFNLAVLYEVESDGATAKKVKLLEQLARLPGEPVHISAFKLQAV